MPTIITLTTTSAGLQAIPEVIMALVPGLDLSAMEGMLSKFKVAKPGTLDLLLDTKGGPVEFILNVTP